MDMWFAGVQKESEEDKRPDVGEHWTLILRLKNGELESASQNQLEQFEVEENFLQLYMLKDNMVKINFHEGWTSNSDKPKRTSKQPETIDEIEENQLITVWQIKDHMKVTSLNNWKVVEIKDLDFPYDHLKEISLEKNGQREVLSPYDYLHTWFLSYEQADSESGQWWHNFNEPKGRNRRLAAAEERC